ncbi:MAG: methyltransferase [Treponema sp.]|jgi:23S rRNA (uracil1939-C5)-methyltransferase|nr:methyltransferase [Treponema sp.]
MKKMHTYCEILIERLSAAGEGIAHSEGKRLVVPFTAPGDRVIAEIDPVHHGRAAFIEIIKIIEIVEQSPVRVAAQCPYFGTCGGCSLQHISYEAQCAEKIRIVQENLSRIGGFSSNSIVPLDIHPSSPFGYRNRVQFHRKEGKIGFMSRHTNQISAIDNCIVAYTAIQDRLQKKQLVVPPDKSRWTVYAYRDTFLSEAEKRRGTVHIGNRALNIDAGVFFQNNGDLLELLIQEIVHYVQKNALNGRAADFYGGVGTLSAFLPCSHIDIIEEQRSAIELAKKNIPYAHCFADTVDHFVRYASKTYDLILVDPPRSGLSQPVHAFLVKQSDLQLVYVSCDSASLARDLKILIEGGYSIEKFSLYDFYPQTAHIESVVFLKK